jgi:antitoxin component of RelBE/YafQ-DinJ toxin-antitoxin module
MTVLFRCRIEKPLLDKANRVTKRLGTSTSEMVRNFVTQIARIGQVPLKLDAGQDDAIAGVWEQRATTLESFYDQSKAWGES